MIRKILHYSLLALVPLLLTGCSLKSNKTTTSTANTDQTLTIWRQPVNKKLDDAAFATIIAAFEKTYKNVKIVYRSFDQSEDYEGTVLNALAAGQGPDIWEIRNDELPRHQDKLAPLGDALSDNYEYFKKNYAASIADEMIVDNTLYGLPIGLDPLVLYANTAHLDDAKVQTIPTDWSGVIELANILTRKVGDNIFRPGLALGTVSNVDRASQILELLMLQFKTQMTDSANRTATFDLYTQDASGQAFDYPGQNAALFYSLFANPQSGFQSWDASQPYSTEAFAAGNLSMMINYQSIAPQIQEINPKLKFKVTTVPQRVERTIPQADLAGGVSDPIYTARYRALVASKLRSGLTAKQKDTKQANVRAFISYATSSKASEQFNEKNWLIMPGLVEGVSTGPYLKTWYKGPSPRTVDQIMSEMLKAITEEKLPLATTMTQAAQLITGILK